MNGKAEAKPCLLLPAQCPFYDLYFLCHLALHLLAFSTFPTPSSEALSLEKGKWEHLALAIWSTFGYLPIWVK